MSISIVPRLKRRDAVLFGAMVALAMAVLLREVVTPLPRASEGPVPARPGEHCDRLATVDASARGATIVGPDGLLVRVRVPLNYDASRAYPLLVAYPPAGFDRFAAERYYGLTEKTTERGWLVAYSDARPLSKHAAELQSGVAEAVAASFCVASDRIVYFGHSDGGAMAQGVIELAPARARPRAIVASGAGITEGDLVARGCHGAISAMIVHNRADARFPDFGRGAARYWAACGGCRAPDLAGMPADTCRSSSGCANGIQVMYCEVDTPHEAFPPIAEKALDFADAATPEPSSP